MKKQFLEDLLHDLEQEMLRLGYTSGSMQFYRRHWQALVKFAQERGETFYSEQLGMDFIENHFQIFQKDLNHILSQSEVQILNSSKSRIFVGKKESCFHSIQDKTSYISSIDYLKYGRPKVDTPYLFVRHLAPFLPFSESDHLCQLIRSYMQLAHFPTLKKRRRYAFPSAHHGKYAS